MSFGARLFLVSALSGWTAIATSALAQSTWHPPEAPDDVRLESEEMLTRGIVKIVSSWEGGNTETGAGMMLGYEGSDLYLITAAHVVRTASLGSARRISIQFLGDLRPHKTPAQLYRYDDDADLAVLILGGFYDKRQLDRLIKYPVDPDFPYTAGEQVIKAIGHPADRDWHVSRGKTLPSGQADRIFLAAGMVTFGNSGGPVLNRENRLVGMVTGGEGESRGIGITVSAMLRILDKWGVPYRTRVVKPLKSVVERIRSAVWQDEWGNLEGEKLRQESNYKVSRAKVSLLASGKSIVVEWFEARSYVELLGTYGATTTLDEAWRVWLRAIANAIGAGYEVKEHGPRRIAFSKYQAFAWPSSRRVTFELLEEENDIYFLVYQFKAVPQVTLRSNRDFLR